MKYGIWITTLREDDDVISNGWYKECFENGQRLIFDTYEEAQAHIDGMAHIKKQRREKIIMKIREYTE